MGIRIVLYGLTGSGKSTSAAIVKDYFEQRAYRVEVLKLAQPLYELQQQFYQRAGQSIGFYDQDQLLLETIATQLRRISATSLIDDFLKRLSQVKADVIINDDLRDPYVDYPILKQQCFRFLRIACQEDIRVRRLEQRHDRSTQTYSQTTSKLDAITPDILIDNSEHGIEKLRSKLHGTLVKMTTAASSTKAFEVQ